MKALVLAALFLLILVPSATAEVEVRTGDDPYNLYESPFVHSARNSGLVAISGIPTEWPASDAIQIFANSANLDHVVARIQRFSDGWYWDGSDRTVDDTDPNIWFLAIDQDETDVKDSVFTVDFNPAESDNFTIRA